MPRNIQKKATTPLSARLLQIMDAMTWSQADLARAADCPRQTVSSWINGQNEAMTDASHAMNLQAASKFNAMWIMTGKGAQRIVEITPKEQRMLDAARRSPELLTAIETILGTRS